MDKDEAEKHAAPDEEVRIVGNTEQEHDQGQDLDKDQGQESAEVINEPTENVASADTETAKPVVSASQPAWKRPYQWAVAHKKVSIPASVLAVLLLLAAIPFTRYALAGVLLKQQYKVAVVDAQTKQPVSSADIMLAGKKATTDGRGFATLQVPVGNASLTVSKKYYKSASQDVLVPIGRQKQAQEIRLTATGRQVPMVVTNTITRKPVAGAVLSVLDTKAKTDKEGRAVLVVPADKTSLEVAIEASGYNKATQTVQVSQGSTKETGVRIVPSGRVYFLSNKSGKLDVVGTNLDGSDRTVVVAGTGREDRYDTTLIPSKDWRYLALRAKRDSDQIKLYLIDTSTGKMRVMDEGDAEFNTHGWAGHHFVYTVDRRNMQYSEPKKFALKSFNATTSKLTTLDESAAEPKTSGFASGYIWEYLGHVANLEDEIVYTKRWSQYNQYYQYSGLFLSGKQHTLMSVRPDGKGRRVVKAYDVIVGDSEHAFMARLYGVDKVRILFKKGAGDKAFSVDEYSSGQIKTVATMSMDEFDTEANEQSGRIVSPKDGRTFWMESRDGKSIFFLGDKNGENEKQIGVLQEFSAYGWYGEYVLVTKKYSELYIAPTTGFDEASLVKIADYYAPPRHH